MAGEESAAAGDHVVIAVRDSGTGVLSEVARRALDPFFTAKAPATAGLARLR